jgi:hypothetical protein
MGGGTLSKGKGTLSVGGWALSIGGGTLSMGGISGKGATVVLANKGPGIGC